MKKHSPDRLEEHLQVIDQMVEKTTDDFFYTRLKARMEKRTEPSQWSFPVKPAWVIGTLLLFVALNFITLNEKYKTTTSVENENTIESFAASYGQTISSPLQ